jgi:hypothetical protein
MYCLTRYEPDELPAAPPRRSIKTHNLDFAAKTVCGSVVIFARRAMELLLVSR